MVTHVKMKTQVYIRVGKTSTYVLAWILCMFLEDISSLDLNILICLWLTDDTSSSAVFHQSVSFPAPTTQSAFSHQQSSNQEANGEYIRFKSLNWLYGSETHVQSIKILSQELALKKDMSGASQHPSHNVLGVT